MEEKKLISIIVPIYNIELYLKECIESLLRQTYRNLEILLVDDGSTDNSSNICDEYAQKDSRIKVIHKKNGGVSSSRKAGIDAATGDYIMMVDGDDWIDEKTIEECVDSASEDIDCVQFSYTKEFSNSTVPMHVMDCSCVLSPADAKEKVYRRLFGLLDEELKYPERMDNIGTCHMKLYKSHIAKNGRYFDNRIIGSSEDTLFNMYALYDCGAMVYIDKCFYHYRKIETSHTNAYRNDLDKKWNILFAEMENVISEKKLDNRYLVALNNRIAMSIIGIGMNEVGNKSARVIKKYSKIRSYLSSKKYHEACIQMPIDQMPIIWKFFFICCKYKATPAVFLMLLAIMQLRKR